MIGFPVLFVIYPLFFVVVITALDSLKWKLIWSALFFVALFLPPANIVYPVAMIIAIPIVKKISDINQGLSR